MKFDEGIFGLYSKLYDGRREIEYSLEEYLGKELDDLSLRKGAAQQVLDAMRDLAPQRTISRVAAGLTRRERRGFTTTGAAFVILPPEHQAEMAFVVALVAAGAALGTFIIHRMNRKDKLRDDFRKEIEIARAAGHFDAMSEVIEATKAKGTPTLFRERDLYSKALKARAWIENAARILSSRREWRSLLNLREYDLVKGFLKVIRQAVRDAHKMAKRVIAQMRGRAWPLRWRVLPPI